jgi:hypothetical protein
MTETDDHARANPSKLDPIDNQWGNQPGDNFGYASEEERRAKRGLEDWELVERMSDSQPGVFPWFRAVIGSVIVGVLLFLLFAYGINFITHHYGLQLLGHE